MNDFINGFRIEEAKKRLQNQVEAECSILEIGFEVGFNSKSTFNHVFRKQTGFSPSQYRKKHFST